MPNAGWFRIRELACSRTSGLVLILSGLAIAGHGALSDFGSGRAPSVASPNVRSQGPVGGTSPGAIVSPRPGDGPPTNASSAPVISAPVISVPVIVLLAPRSGKAGVARVAAIPRDRDSLARELQKELRRVGCYEGELNGAWTPATRRAMKTFTERVNATLPVDEPDAVLFAMVQSQQDRVCGKPCPVDQGLSEDGRCLPNVILAKAARKPSPSAVATHVPASGGPADKPPPAHSSWSVTVTAARPMAPAVGVPAPATPPPSLAVTQPAPATPPPSEGRMALAGPTAEQVPAGAATTGPLAPPRPATQSSPKRSVPGSESWTRTMNARRFDSPN
jgi:hypothetical protein